jgi:hypothetical protein
MSSGRSRIALWSCVPGLVLLALAAFIWMRVLHRARPAGLLKDIRAGMAARHIQDPDARLLRYLNERYGSMSEPAHRREAFLDFFNLDHIQGLQLLVKHSPDDQRQANINAMARWVETYRNSLAPEDRTELNALFQTPEGQGMLKRATAQYNSQDVRYRGATAPVISQLLRTLREVQQTP